MGLMIQLQGLDGETVAFDTQAIRAYEETIVLYTPGMFHNGYVREADREEDIKEGDEVSEGGILVGTPAGEKKCVIEGAWVLAPVVKTPDPTRAIRVFLHGHNEPIFVRGSIMAFDSACIHMMQQVGQHQQKEALRQQLVAGGKVPAAALKLPDALSRKS